MKRLLIASAISFASLGAYAQLYGEVGYTSTTAKENADGDGLKASPAAIRGLLGYEINPNFAVEGMAAFGLGESTIKVNGRSVPDAKLGIDNAIGLYLKPKVKLNEKVEIFGRAGFARVEGTATVKGVASESSSESGFSYGAGLSFAMNPTTSLNADYMQYLNKDGFKINGFTFGVGFKF